MKEPWQGCPAWHLSVENQSQSNTEISSQTRSFFWSFSACSTAGSRLKVSVKTAQGRLLSERDLGRDISEPFWLNESTYLTFLLFAGDPGISVIHKANGGGDRLRRSYRAIVQTPSKCRDNEFKRDSAPFCCCLPGEWRSFTWWSFNQGSVSSNQGLLNSSALQMSWPYLFIYFFFISVLAHQRWEQT